MSDGIVAPVKTDAPIALIVDDAEENRYIASQVLANLGYDIREATNGYEALVHLNTSLFPIELMVLDLMMPVLDGYGVLRELDTCKWKPRVIVVSAFVRQIKADALSRADTVMGKPLDLERFLATVKTFAGVA